MDNVSSDNISGLGLINCLKKRPASGSLTRKLSVAKDEISYILSDPNYRHNHNLKGYDNSILATKARGQLLINSGIVGANDTHIGLSRSPIVKFQLKFVVS
jgi:hypothetical protein